MSIYIGLGIDNGQGGLTSETIELSKRFTTAPTAKRLFEYNTLIKAIKDVGAWSLHDVLFNFAIHNDSTDARRNWIEDNNLSAVNGPTFTANVGSNSSTGTLARYNSAYRMNFSTAKATYDNNTFYVYVDSRDTTTSNVPQMYFDGSNQIITSLTGSSSLIYSVKNFNTTSLNYTRDTGNPLETNFGLHAVTRDGTTVRLYINGRLVSTQEQTPTNTASNILNIMGSTALSSVSTQKYKFAGAGAFMTEAQITAMGTAMDNYLTSIAS